MFDKIETLNPKPSSLCTAICTSPAGPEPWVAIKPYMPETLISLQERFRSLLLKDPAPVPKRLFGNDMVVIALRDMETVVR